MIHASRARCALLALKLGLLAAMQSAGADDVSQSGATDGWRFREGRGLQLNRPGLSLRLSGLAQFDTAWTDGDERAIDEHFEVRRGRVALRGRLGHGWGFGAEADFSRQDPMLAEASLRYGRIARGHLTAGYIKEPIGLEWQGSSRSAIFMERSLASVFLPPYHVGARMNWSGRRWSVATGAFGGGIYGDDPIAGDWSLTTRATFAPIRKRHRVVHLGLGGSWRQREGNRARLRLEPRPEVHLVEALADTGIVRRVDDQQLLAAEFAVAEGPLSLQAEYLSSWLHRSRGRQDLRFEGGYITASWFLTGESRPYDARLGRFLDLRPRHPVGHRGGLGAWEVALRYSELDLDDGPISGGQQRNLSLALNWYPRRSLRVMANVVLIDPDGVDRRGRDLAASTVFQLRTQIEL